MRRQIRRPLSRAARLTKEWLTFWSYEGADPTIHTSVLLLPGQIFTDWIISPEDALGLLDEPTVMRMIFQAQFTPPNMTANTSSTVSYGIIATRAEGFGLGPPIIDPRQDGYMDFLWTSVQSAVAGNAGAVINYTHTSRESLWDIRSRRKLDPGEGLAFYALSEATNLGNLRIMANGRVLYAH